MITLRKAQDRGRSRLDWLDSFHTFSFADYQDVNHMGFSVLRVINDDRVVPGGGFPTHSHKDMEIITYVLSGSLEHKDSMGNTSIIHPGDTQRMSAGKGVTHSEYNASDEHPVHFLQIWILPSEQDIDPSYEQQHVPIEAKQGRLKLIASPTGERGSVSIHQDAYLYVSVLDKSAELGFAISSDRKIYVHVAKGAICLNGESLCTGYGAKIENENNLNIRCMDQAEILLFDLPPV